jgi:hypothetical protein
VVTAAGPDTIAVRAVGDSLATVIPRADLDRLEWPSGTRRKGFEGMLVGTLAGLAVGSVVALSISCDDDVLGLCPIGQFMVAGAIATTGSTVGGVIGLLNRKLLWQRVEPWPGRAGAQ